MAFSSGRESAFFDCQATVELQEKLLREHVQHCLKFSPFYRKHFESLPFDPVSMSLSRLQDLPFTQKIDIENDNDSFVATTHENISDIVLSSGTTGEPIIIRYSENDLKRLAYNEEKSLHGCGVNSDDVVLLTCTMDRCFVAGLAYFLGVRNIGAASIRNGHGSMESHAMIIKKMNPTVIIGVPSFLRKLGAYLDASEAKPQSNSVQKLICIGEPVRDEQFNLLQVGVDLEHVWQARTFSTYASSEIVTTFCECESQCGGHLHPDLAIVEIVNDEGDVLPFGSRGEVVVTPLAVEAMPLVRYRTGDISFLTNEPCSCGRVSPRLGPILGRKQQMLKCKGTSLYPHAIYCALDEIVGVSEYYVEVTKAARLADHIAIYLATTDAALSEESIQDQLVTRLRVKPEVVIENEEIIKKKVFSSKSRKPVRFFDRR